MQKIIIIADRIMPDSRLIGLISDHFPDREIVILRRDEKVATAVPSISGVSGISEFVKEVKW